MTHYSTDECEAPPNFQELAGPNNFNGSVCLNYQCMYDLQEAPLLRFGALASNVLVPQVRQRDTRRHVHC